MYIVGLFTRNILQSVFNKPFYFHITFCKQVYLNKTFYKQFYLAMQNNLQAKVYEQVYPYNIFYQQVYLYKTCHWVHCNQKY